MVMIFGFGFGFAELVACGSGAEASTSSCAGPAGAAGAGPMRCLRASYCCWLIAPLACRTSSNSLNPSAEFGVGLWACIIELNISNRAIIETAQEALKQPCPNKKYEGRCVPFMKTPFYAIQCSFAPIHPALASPYFSQASGKPTQRQ